MAAVSYQPDPPGAVMTRIERIRLMDWHVYAVYERMTTGIKAWDGMTQGEYDFTVQQWTHWVFIRRQRLKQLRKDHHLMGFKEGEYAIWLRKAQNQLNAVQNDLIAIQAAWRKQGGV